MVAIIVSSLVIKIILINCCTIQLEFYITAVLSQFAAFARRDMTLVPGNHDPEVDVM